MSRIGYLWGRLGEFLSSRSKAGSIIKDGDRYLLYYCGYQRFRIYVLDEAKTFFTKPLTFFLRPYLLTAVRTLSPWAIKSFSAQADIDKRSENCLAHASGTKVH